MHILVVDDSERVRTVVATILEAAGCRVDQAADGLSGLKQFMAEQPDAIMTDINMPVMDGLSFVARIRAQPGGQALPIFVLSSDECPGKREQARAYGVRRWMEKPIDPRIVIETVIETAAG